MITGALCEKSNISWFVRIFCKATSNLSFTAAMMHVLQCVRFVYFSPRNMRRTKEPASQSQMGLDVAWNCCISISLRPLEEGADDTFRMTSNYADWDVNAKLPHGVEDVKRHLEEVGNVPLLVSLYKDVSKNTTATAEMVDVFQDYNDTDTVLAVGLPHLPGNQEVFFGSDIAIGVDVLSEEVSFVTTTKEKEGKDSDTLVPNEVAFVSSTSLRGLRVSI